MYLFSACTALVVVCEKVLMDLHMKPLVQKLLYLESSSKVVSFKTWALLCLVALLAFFQDTFTV